MRWLFALALCFAPALATAQSVVADLSQNRVSITANFDGSEILIFGAITPDPADPRPFDVIVTVAGPDKPVTVRKKDRVAGIWVNTDAIEVQSAPSLYKVATTAPLEDILADDEDQRYKITVPRAILQTAGVGREPFYEALIRIRQNDGLYLRSEGNVTVRDNALFRTTIALPANLVEGAYNARIFLVRDGQVEGFFASVLDVQKVGLERLLYTMAHEQPLLYGLLSLFIAIAAGWSASAIFRYLRG